WGDRPLLVIHGESDHLVPRQQAEAIVRSAGPTCRAVYLPQVGHCDAFKTDPDGYINRIDRFFCDHLER
ncbi:MAG TPA: alpha/beta hydrolase, partial [Isosphaeraceae bacterium]|nr:alpha/beta hydrolase [Isosphaeraceae bacterium]